MRTVTVRSLVLMIILAFAGCAGLRLDRVLKPSNLDWTMYGGKPNRVNRAPGSVQPPLEKIWQYSAQGGLLGSPLVRDSVMIVGTLKGELQAVNLTNGKRLGYKIFESALVGTPILDGTLVIVTLAGKTETLFSYDLWDGRKSWSFPAGPIESSPLLVEGKIYVTTLSGILYCVDERTGDEQWKFETGEEELRQPIRSSPASDGTIIVFGSDAGIIYAVDRTKGILRWSVETGASVFATPIVVSGVVIVGNLHGTVFGIDANTGAIQWKIETGSRVFGPASADESVAFTGSADGVLHALDVRTGTEKWKFEAKSVINSAPLVAGSLLYVGSLDRTLYCLDSGTGRELWRYVADGRIKVTPVLWGDMLLVTSEDKYITALRPRGSL